MPLDGILEIGKEKCSSLFLLPPKTSCPSEDIKEVLCSYKLSTDPQKTAKKNACTMAPTIRWGILGTEHVFLFDLH